MISRDDMIGMDASSAPAVVPVQRAQENKRQVEGAAPMPTPGPSWLKLQKEGAMDLSVLSPSTLKMLNIADPKRFYKKQEGGGDMDIDDDLTLTAVVDRLNSAAAKSRKRRSRSLDDNTGGSSSSREGRPCFHFGSANVF